MPEKSPSSCTEEKSSENTETETEKEFLGNFKFLGNFLGKFLGNFSEIRVSLKKQSTVCHLYEVPNVVSFRRHELE